MQLQVRAHLRSHSGCNAGGRLSHAPTAKEHTIPPHLFRVLLMERLQLPFASHRGDMCLDVRGVHRAACTLSGRVKKRATPTERVLARVCREAGACVPFAAFLRDMKRRRGRQRRQTNRGLGAGPSMLWWYSTRSRHHFAECPDTCGGESQRNAADIDGAVLINARREEPKYPDLAACRRCKLVVAIETGGRWS